MRPLVKNVAITGLGTTQFARSLPDRSIVSLKCEAAIKAIQDAGLAKNDIDGMVTDESNAESGGNPRIHIELSEYLGIFPKGVCTSIPMGGATPGFCLDVARWAVSTGRCRNVLIVVGGKMSSLGGRTTLGHGTTSQLSTWPGHSRNYEHPYGPLMITFYAAVAQRHMYEYGTTSEQLAAVAVACRRHASLNPESLMRRPITVEDVVSSRMISSPLHLLDCCIISDGGCAFVVSNGYEARSTRHKPVWVLGSGGGQSSYFMGSLALGDPARPGREYSMTRSTGKMAAVEAFAEAGVERGDIDLVTSCDNFTITPIVLLEDYGFCKKGEGGAFVEGGRIEIGGELPFNTHGGLLSNAHFGPGLFMNYVEAVRQLRWECGDRQVKGAELAVAATCAGVISTHQVSILARD